MFNRRIVRGVLLAAIVMGLVISGCKKGNGDGEGVVAVTKDNLANAIEDYVMEQAALSEGYFVITDDVTGEDLKLTLDKVHRKRLARIDRDEYFACADFIATDGRVFDLDVFMKGADKDNLEFSQFMVHKVDGKERYTWLEDQGVWRRKFIVQPNEQPAEEVDEHPKEQPIEDPDELPNEHPTKETDELPSEHPKK